MRSSLRIWVCAEHENKVLIAWYAIVFLVTFTAVKPVYSGHLGTQKNYPYYRGVLFQYAYIIHLYTLISYRSGTTA